MKSEDLQKLLLSQYEAGQTPKKIFENLNGAVSYLQSNDGVRRSGKLVSYIYRNHLLVTEQFARRQPYKRSKDQKKIKG